VTGCDDCDGFGQSAHACARARIRGFGKHVTPDTLVTGPKAASGPLLHPGTSPVRERSKTPGPSRCAAETVYGEYRHPVLMGVRQQTADGAAKSSRSISAGPSARISVNSARFARNCASDTEHGERQPAIPRTCRGAS